MEITNDDFVKIRIDCPIMGNQTECCIGKRIIERIVAEQRFTGKSPLAHPLTGSEIERIVAEQRSILEETMSVSASKDKKKRKVGVIEDYTPYQRPFFKAIEEHVPEVLHALRKEVLPVFSQSFECFPYIGAKSGAKEITLFQLLEPLDDIQAVLDRAIPGLTLDVWNAIESWGRHYGLFCKKPTHQASDASPLRLMTRYYDSPTYNGFLEASPAIPQRLYHPDPEDVDRVLGAKWVSRATIRTLYAWHKNPELTSCSVLRWVMPEAVPSNKTLPTADPRKYTFELDGWDPREEDRSEVRIRLEKKVNEIIGIELDKDEKRLIEFGMEKKPVKIEVCHFRWLALYQVKGQSTHMIAKNQLGHNAPEEKITNLKWKIEKALKDTPRVVAGPGWPKWLRKGKKGPARQ